MTTIDQAFIRAYLQQTAGRCPPAKWQQKRPRKSRSIRRKRLPRRKRARWATVRARRMTKPLAGKNRRSGHCLATRKRRVALSWEIRRRRVARGRKAHSDRCSRWTDLPGPKRAASIRMAAGAQVDRMADGLAAGVSEGRNVVALAGSRRYQGCTTLLLCAAKRLADRGLSVAMVDADFAHPALAARLGLLPDAGLEAVLADRLPLEEATIESLDDAMAVVPVAGPSSGWADSPRGKAILARAIRTLRRQLRHGAGGRGRGRPRHASGSRDVPHTAPLGRRRRHGPGRPLHADERSRRRRPAGSRTTA